MTLLVLMYHRARAGPHGNSAEILDAHFGHIAAMHHTVMPGEALAAGRLNLCLTFDDGFYDFYAIVLPLLRKYNLRALLAVPPLVVRESVDATAPERLAVETGDGFAHPSKGAFCTWPELEEIAASGHVSIAAHGYTHRQLDGPGIPLETEIDAPQTILSSRLNQPVDSFVFPCGRFSRTALRQAATRYRHLFCGGDATNSSWSRVLYRVDGDEMPRPTALFSPGRLLLCRARALWRRVRFPLSGRSIPGFPARFSAAVR